MRSIFVPLAVGAVVACFAFPRADAATFHIQTPFLPADFQPWSGPGPATIRGQAFMKTRGGDVKTCAGTTVILVPLNAYGREFLAADRQGFTAADNADPHFADYLRQVTCDAQGNFVFAGVPAGPWAIEAVVTWQTSYSGPDDPGPLTMLLLGIKPHPDMDMQGGGLVKEINAVAGENTVYVTDADRP